MEKLWTPTEAAKLVFTSIGISQADQGLQLDYLRLLRACNPDLQLTENTQELASTELNERILAFLNNGHIRVTFLPVNIQTELDFQKNQAISELGKSPPDLTILTGDILQGLIFRDHYFLTKHGGRGSQAPCSYASFLRNLLLNQLPFPIADKLKPVHHQIQQAWNDEEKRKDILVEHVWHRSMQFTGCDLKETTYGERLSHVKRIWEQQHPNQSFEII